MRLLPIRAAASEDASEEFVKQAEEVLNDLKAKVIFGHRMRHSTRSLSCLLPVVGSLMAFDELYSDSSCSGHLY